MMVRALKIGAMTILVLALLVGLSACDQKTETAKEPEEREKKETGAKYVPAKKPSAVAGEKVYRDNCADCHGATGAGDGPTAKSLPDKPKNFTDLQFMRREEPQEFYENITYGKESMPAFKKKLSEAERWDVLFYVWSRATSPARIADGKDTFQKTCTTCHGESGNGKGPAARSLEEKPPAFNDPKFMMREKGNSFYKVLTNGEKPMPAFNTRLTDDQRWNAVDYIWTFVYEPAPE